jgi:ComF family protein
VLKTVPYALTSFLGAFRDFLYPPVCASCDGPRDSRRSVFCPTCASSLRPLDREEQLYGEIQRRLLSAGNVSGLLSCYLFEEQGALQSAMHRLKYQHCPSVGFEFGVRLGETIARQTDPRERLLVVPVPLHRAKLRERGYNQSRYICDGIATIAPCTVFPRALVRQRYTRSQTTLTRDERTRNVHGAFSVPARFREAVRGSSILIVDDVITTGATINECAAALHASGARDVVACSVALAP